MYFLVLCCCLLTFITTGEAGAQPSVKAPFIYVADFELEAENVHESTGILPQPLGRRGPIGQVRSPAISEEDAEAKARKMIDLMSNSVVNDLKNLGYGSRRLSSKERLPETGMLVRGLFANVDEGNRLRRAAIGFGAGQTDLQVIVSVSNLGRGNLEPFYDINTGAQRGKLPGAIITLNPYVAAAKFVLAGKDMKKGITKTASKIASAVDKEIQTTATGTDGATAHPLPESELDK
jgi:hypothetical protein